jgi:hypothetical protein
MRALLSLAVAVAMLAPACTPGYKKECHRNALVRGRAELSCKDVKATRLDDNVLVVGCGKTVVYECYGGTPEREGSRAERLSGS